VSGAPIKLVRPLSGADLIQTNPLIMSECSAQTLVFEHGILLLAHSSQFVHGVHCRSGCPISTGSVTFAAIFDFLYLGVVFSVIFSVRYSVESWRKARV
jgi:hypothetical protein